jgi:hypothetical protein
MSNKKLFLSLGTALSIVAAGAATSFAKDKYEEATGTQFVTESSLLSGLLMEEQKDSVEGVQTAGHSSHASHGSHMSHSSHSSGS